MRPFRLLFIVAWWIAATAQAHWPSDARLNLDTTQKPFTLQWDITLCDLDYLLSMDRDSDGALTWGEVRAQHPANAASARAYLQPLRLKVGHVPWVLKNQLWQHTAVSRTLVCKRTQLQGPTRPTVL